MGKVTLDDLIYTADELNRELQLAPAIDVATSADKISKMLCVAAKLIHPKDRLSKRTIKVLLAIKADIPESFKEANKEFFQEIESEMQPTTQSGLDSSSSEGLSKQENKQSESPTGEEDSKLVEKEFSPDATIDSKQLIDDTEEKSVEVDMEVVVKEKDSNIYPYDTADEYIKKSEFKNYREAVKALLELARYKREEIVEAIINNFDVKPVTIKSFLSDCKNPKYTRIKGKIIKEHPLKKYLYLENIDKGESDAKK